jgi:hypothetical protein
MATGAGKTKVLLRLIAWSFFHRLYETDSSLSRNFLVIAPNIIVGRPSIACSPPRRSLAPDDVRESMQLSGVLTPRRMRLNPRRA